MRTKSYNRFDLSIFLLITTTAFGDIGGNLQVTRLVGILLVPLLMVSLPKCKFAKPYGICILFFWAYCICSLLWTLDKDEGLKQLVYYIVHLLIFLEILVFSKFARNPLQSILNGWLIAVSLTLVVAMWELVTDKHLIWSRFESEEVINTKHGAIYRRFAAVAFFNYNTYVTFLCFALPFLYGCLEEISSWKYQRLLASIAIILSIVCILFNSSRGGLISVMIMSLIYFWIHVKNFQSMYLFVFLLIGFGIIVYYFGDEMFLAIRMRMEEADNSLVRTDEGRFVIWENALKAFKPTAGLGTGVGGVQAAISRVTSGVIIPHNLLLEILVQFGCIFFLIFLRFLWKLWRNARRLSRESLRHVIYMALCAFPVYTIIDSSVLLKTFLYVAMASLTVIANYERIKPVY